MSLYRIILADDEEEIRDGIKRKIDWAGNGFELVGSAENGQEALEMAESLHPDVVYDRYQNAVYGRPDAWQTLIGTDAGSQNRDFFRI